MTSWRSRTEAEKTTAEKMRLEYCKCGHTNTLHAGGFGECAFILGKLAEKEWCPCKWFTASTPSTFAEVREIMQGEGL